MSKINQDLNLIGYAILESKLIT